MTTEYEHFYLRIYFSLNTIISYQSNESSMIHQPSSQVLPGNDGFNTKAAAQKASDLVIQKIKNGEMPPSITKVEMQKIGSLK
jgi:hypothetical protein